MRHHVDLALIWKRGISTAQSTVEDQGLWITAPMACPFALDECLDDDFSVDAALAKLAAAPRPDVA